MEKSKDEQFKDYDLINLPEGWQEIIRKSVPSEIEKLEKSPAFIFIDKVRGREIGEYDTISELRSISGNYEKELLSALLKDVSLYLELHKKDLISMYDYDEFVEEIHKWQSAGKDIPFQKPGIGINNINHEMERFVDLEKLMFPDEFTPVYNLQKMIEDKLKDQDNDINQPTEHRKINWDFSELEIVELGKALCEMNKPKDATQKEVIAALGDFFNLELDSETQRVKIDDIKKRPSGKNLFLESLSTQLDLWKAKRREKNSSNK